MGLFGVAEILLTIERPHRQVVKTKLDLAAALARGMAPLAWAPSAAAPASASSSG